MYTLFCSRDGYYVETLLSFSQTSGVRPNSVGEDFTADMAEITGPMPALIKSSFNARSGNNELLQSFVVASASNGIFEPITLQSPALTNTEYFLNLLGDLVNKESMINIEPKSLSGDTLAITSRQASRLGVVLIGILPGTILLTGVAVWLVRRYK
jgi:ABC-type uncharacterized transport system involved in gliding motility auxiliary subunit